MIRQAISCDICGTEKKQTNHWFVAYDQGGELRIGGWSSRNRLRQGARHLCGQTCLHKLVDEFMARAISSKSSQTAAEPVAEEAHAALSDTSLTSDAAYGELEFESSARLIPHVEKTKLVEAATTAAKPVLPAAAATTAVKPVLPATAAATPQPAPHRAPLHAPVEMMPAAARVPVEALPPAEEALPQFTSRSWRAEAWERERERELRAVERRPEIPARRRASR